MEAFVPRARKFSAGGFTGALFLAGLAVLALAVPATADNLCGATITEDLDLTNDLMCPESGLTVGADRVTIRLNGHTIAGSGTVVGSFGIRVAGRSEVAIRGPGTLMGFTAGVLIEASREVEVEGLTATMNGLMVAVMAPEGAGIRIVDSMVVTVRENSLSGNQNSGIFVGRSTGVWVVENSVVGGGHDGIQLREAHGNVIRENVASAPAPPGCAIQLISSNHNVVAENEIGRSGFAGILVTQPAGATQPSTGNEIQENTITDSTAGIRLDRDARGNDLRENVVSGNVDGILAVRGATRNLLVENEIVGNTNGISFVGPAPEALSNTYASNVVTGNACGIKGSPTELDGNTFLDNELSGNTQDVCTE